MPDMNNAQPDTLPGNDPILTDAERQLLADVDVPNGGDIPANTDAPENTETPPVGGVSASDHADVGDPAVAAPPQAQANSLPALHNDARDFKAEREALDTRYSEQLAGLKEKYADGGIDDDAYDAERERLVQARQDERDELTAARVKWETRAELAEEFAQHTWQQNVRMFLSQPENGILLRSDAIQQVWQSMMQRAVNEAAAAGSPLTTDADIMTAGRNLLFQDLGLSAAANPSPVAPPSNPKPPVTPPKLDNLPPSVGRLPGASPNGAVMTGEELAGLGINDLERQMAGMSEAQIDALLRATPGAFIE